MITRCFKCQNFSPVVLNNLESHTHVTQIFIQHTTGSHGIHYSHNNQFYSERFRCAEKLMRQKMQRKNSHHSPVVPEWRRMFESLEPPQSPAHVQTEARLDCGSAPSRLPQTLSPLNKEKSQTQRMKSGLNLHQVYIWRSTSMQIIIKH